LTAKFVARTGRNAWRCLKPTRVMPGFQPYVSVLSYPFP